MDKPKRTCSVEGCQKPAHARGLCGMHHERWRRTGDIGPAHSLVKRALDPGEEPCSMGCGGLPFRRGLCRRCYTAVGQARRAMSVEERFWECVDTSAGPDRCWEWARGRHKAGYGVFYVGSRTQVLAHRWVTGAQPGDEVLHACDNPPCVNPAHLRIGTHADNMADAAAKGRSQPGRRIKDTCPKGHPMCGDNLRVGKRQGPHGKVYVTHSCRECGREDVRNRRAKKREQAAA